MAVTGAPVLIGKKRALEVYDLEEDFLDRFAASSGLKASYRGKDLIAVAFTGASSAVAELKRCREDLLTSFGIDPKARAALKKMPVRTNKSSVFRRSDYHLEALRGQPPSAVVVRYTVGVDGSVTACAPVVPSGHPWMDEVTCNSLVSRARYEPGLDSEGKPTPVSLVTTVHYLPPSGR